MAQVVAYVESNPGRYMRAAAHWVNPHPIPSKNEALGYNVVNRALAAGLIRAERGPRGWLLYPITVTLAEIEGASK